jgi:hypothetical protein
VNAQVAPTINPASTGSDELNHIYCCDPDIALCGTDISADNEVDLDVANCVVCLDLEAAALPCSDSCPTGVAR